MDVNKLDILLEKYANNSCSEEERMLLELWIEKLPEADRVELSMLQKQLLLKQLDAKIASRQAQPIRQIGWKRYLPYAAAVLILALASVLVWRINQKHSNTIVQQIGDKVVPGSDKAVLTLANGKKIELSAEQAVSASGITVTRTSDGQLKYVVSKDAVIPGEYQVIETPRGGQFQIELSDGSEVTLNAASSLRFPTDLTHDKLRTVELKGEGYFVVAKDKQRPFIVKSDQQEVRVLGTVFNVNTYDLNNSMTTLLEGKVEINKERVLAPGQQSRVKGKQISVAQVDVDDYVDWKHNEFIFRDESLESILTRVARWYNVDVIYINKAEASKHTTFSGKISRYADVEKILELLQGASDLKISIQHKTIIVNP
ncbi:FecR family protein [Sphingobacterium sp. BIGb0165]|uniref:FecR family protein n=1 Tax=Sphingobacterium sp. BIGb0165 TaxID=2940615 RepID=UPI002169A840|nr:FecR domain-containing protein [Sphingobacterium sp. BIGb0165]MCS4226369.1 ferric-dicitrate binding protein FerR (iron transport regulator) [Sphingobacterium sp. BIGb0165]